MENFESKFIECLCGRDIIRVTFYKEQPFNEIGLSVYKYANSRVPWRARLRHAWHCIRWGSPYEDDILLDIKEAQKFRDKLDEMIKEPVKDTP